MPDAKRTQLKKKIEAGEARNKARGQPTFVDKAGGKAIEAKDKFTAFAKEHPIATVAGGLALGVLISSLFKRSPTRKLGGKAAGKAAGLAAIGAEAALAYARQAMASAGEAGRAGADKLDEFGDSLSHSARTVRRDAGQRASELSDGARFIARSAGKRLERAVRKRAN
jgi:uncharacterized membrane protein YebE (DUF533 family)